MNYFEIIFENVFPKSIVLVFGDWNLNFTKFWNFSNSILPTIQERDVWS